MHVDSLAVPRPRSGGGLGVRSNDIGTVSSRFTARQDGSSIFTRVSRSSSLDVGHWKLRPPARPTEQAVWHTTWSAGRGYGDSARSDLATNGVTDDERNRNQKDGTEVRRCLR